MKVTIETDDDLIAQAREYTEIDDLSELINEALKVLIAREMRRREMQ